MNTSSRIIFKNISTEKLVTFAPTNPVNNSYTLGVTKWFQFLFSPCTVLIYKESFSLLQLHSQQMKNITKINFKNLTKMFTRFLIKRIFDLTISDLTSFMSCENKRYKWKSINQRNKGWTPKPFHDQSFIIRCLLFSKMCWLMYEKVRQVSHLREL